MSQLYLELRRHGRIRHGHCALCARPYESVGSGWALRCGERRGYVCVQCLERGPRRAASRLRRRAARNRAIGHHIYAASPSPLGVAVRRECLQFADFLDTVADETAGMETWPAA